MPWVHVWPSEDTAREWLLAFHPVGPLLTEPTHLSLFGLWSLFVLPPPSPELCLAAVGTLACGGDVFSSFSSPWNRAVDVESSGSEFLKEGCRSYILFQVYRSWVIHLFLLIDN